MTNTSPHSPTTPRVESTAMGKVPIWDAPVRVIHWLAALSVLGAWVTSEMDRLRAVHISFGLTLAGLMVARVLWGWIGSKPARFSSFLRSPSAAWAHLQALARGKAVAHSGHNPAGGWAVVALIGMSLALTLSGWLLYTRGESFEDLHETLANVLVALVGVHVLAVVVTSVLLRTNLVRAMFSGRQKAPANEAIPNSYRALGGLVAVAVLAFWVWGMGPATPFTGEAGDARAEHGEHDRAAGRQDDDD